MVSSKPELLVYDKMGNILSGRFYKTFPSGPILLKDEVLNYTFVLDSNHIYISAYDSIGHLLWKTDLYKENLNSSDRATRMVTNIYFGKNTDIHLSKPHKVLWVRYGRAGGYLDLKTGVFRLDIL